MLVTDPTVTKVGKWHLQVEWPDPPRATYEVAHEVLAELIEMVNDLADEMGYEREYR